MLLKQKVISGVKWTTLSTVSNASAQLLQIVILARFLNPEQFGLMAIIMLVIGFSQMFVDLGISSAIIHKQDVTHNQLSTLYWLNLLSGFIVYGLIIFFAPFIADFYQDSSLTNLIILTSITIVIQSFGKQFHVLFEKELQFNIIAKIDITSSLAGLLFAIFLAMNDFGIYSLIYPLILSASVKSILFIYKGLSSHKPKFYFNFSDVKEFIIFGLYLMGSGIINYLNSQFDIIIIGKVFGSEVLGLYSITKQLVMRPSQIINPIITRVTFPIMAKVQDDQIKLKGIYLKMINYLSSINFPIYIIMIILAPELIIIFLGEKWIGVIVIFQILSIYALIRSTGNPVGSLTLAKGKPEYGFYWTIGLFFFIPITIYTSSFYGVEGVCWGLAGLMIVLVIPNWYFLVKKLCKANFIEYHMQIIKPLLIAGIAGIISFIISKIFIIDNVFFSIFIVTLVNFIILLVLNFFFNKSLINILKDFLKKKSIQKDLNDMKEVKNTNV